MNTARFNTLEGDYGIFGSSISFLNDLIEIGHIILKHSDRKTILCEYLQEINQKLPAEVYLPSKNP